MFPFLGSPTGSFAVTGVLGIIVFIYMHYSGIRENGLQQHLHAFIPHLDMPVAIKLPILALLVPIEFIGVVIRCFVLAVRLFANMFAGHMVLATVLIFIWQARTLLDTNPALFWTITAGSVL